jgi:TorA maturation chaperone TorD
MSASVAGLDIEVQVRAEVYAFLSRSVQYPRGPVVCGLLEHVRFDDEFLEGARASMVGASGGEVDTLQAAYRVLFPAVESQDAPSYQTAYSKRDVFRQGQVMADVAGFYRAHGLNIGGSTKDRPDGIGPELEFLGFLAAKQARALADGNADMADLCLSTQKSFLRDHLGAWGPEYGRRVAAVSHHGFYEALGEFLATWLESDMERLHVVPVEVDAGLGGDAVPVPDPRVGWDDLSCGGVV